jgi:hypothetical protein
MLLKQNLLYLSIKGKDRPYKLLQLIDSNQLVLVE